MASQVHDLVSNDPILDSKVVPDELGQLGRPAERAGHAWPARAGQPGRPVAPAGRWAALQGREGEEGRAKESGSAQESPPPTPITAGGLFHMNPGTGPFAITMTGSLAPIG